jgi:thiol-activated cytolysin
MRTKMNSLMAALTVISLLVFLPQCQKDTFDEASLNEFLKTLPSIATEMPAEKAATLVDTDEETTSEFIYHYDYYEAAAGFDEQIVLNPQTDVIYPGALVKGESILDGTYTLIPASRNPITISTSLTGSGKVSVTVDDPKLSTIREAVNSLMNQQYDVPPANMGFTVEQAYSEQQLDLALRASYKGNGVNVKGGFDFSNKQVKSRLVAKFIQSYYTLDMDLPDQPSDLFAEDIERSLFGVYMPMYVSTVTFGRMALFTIESEYSETEVKAFLNASYSAAQSASGSVSTEFDQLKAKSTMKVYILGGSGGDAGTAINGFQDFKNYIISGGNYSKTSPGAPISYKLRYIKDNSIGKIVFMASYPIVTAIPRTDNLIYDVTAVLDRLDAHGSDAGGGNMELWGAIYAWAQSKGEATKTTIFGYYSEAGHLSVPVSGVYILRNLAASTKSWIGLAQNDVMYTNIRIHETDSPFGSDAFTPATFTVPLSEIVILQQGQPLERQMRVTMGGDYIDFFMKYTYIARRTSR